MAKHVHGSTDITAKQETFVGFVNFAKWTIVVIIATLIFLAIVNG